MKSRVSSPYTFPFPVQPPETQSPNEGNRSRSNRKRPRRFWGRRFVLLCRRVPMTLYTGRFLAVDRCHVAISNDAFFSHGCPSSTPRPTIICTSSHASCYTHFESICLGSVRLASRAHWLSVHIRQLPSSPHCSQPPPTHSEAVEHLFHSHAWLTIGSMPL